MASKGNNKMSCFLVFVGLLYLHVGNPSYKAFIVWGKMKPKRYPLHYITSNQMGFLTNHDWTTGRKPKSVDLCFVLLF